MARRPSKGSSGRSSGSILKSSTSSATSQQALATTTKTAAAGTAGPVTATDVNNLPIASLTLDTPLNRLRQKRPPRCTLKAFDFLFLPSELRIKVYAYYFADVATVLDLGPDNRPLPKLLGLLRVCHQVRSEATYIFYETRTFRLFPTFPGRYFKAKKPLLARMKPYQRANITSLELRLGPGWNAPPKGWAVNDALGLKDCVNAHKLRVFVEFDPSHGAFKEFRRSDGFYEGFSRNLLTEVLNGLPAVEVIEFDGWSGVKKKGGMMNELLDVARQSKASIQWGPERGWTDGDDDGDDDSISAGPTDFLQAMASQTYGSLNISVGA